MAGASNRPQMHFGPGQHTYPAHQGFQYPQMQPSPYLGILNQQPGLAQGQGQVSQPYPQNLQLQRPGLYQQNPNPGAVAQQNPGSGITTSQAGGNAPGSWPHIQTSGGFNTSAGGQPQSSSAPGMAQMAVSQGAGVSMQGMFLRPPHSPLPQGGMLHNFPLGSQSPRPGVQQQPGMPGMRPASFLQVIQPSFVNLDHCISCLLAYEAINP